MFRLHHIGCLVDDIAAAVEMYKTVFGFKEAGEAVYVSQQRVQVCLVQMNDGVSVELIRPDDDSPLLKYRQKNINYYHLAYATDDIDKAIEDIVSKGGVLLNTYFSEAFDNKKCAFLFTPVERNLIELIQAS